MSLEAYLSKNQMTPLWEWYPEAPGPWAEGWVGERTQASQDRK